MNLQERIHGFRLDREEYIQEANGKVLEFTHEQTGARLIYISNNDNNKVFHIAF